MSCLGVHLALTEQHVGALRSRQTDAERLEFLQTELEPYFFETAPEWKAESDKAWDAIHRVLTDGRLAYDNGTYPLSHVILGGERLYTLDDYIMSLKSPTHVADAGSALEQITEDVFRRRYYAIDEQDYGVALCGEDFEHSWSWFCGIRDFWRKAAGTSRHILFTADQ